MSDGEIQTRLNRIDNSSFCGCAALPTRYFPPPLGERYLFFVSKNLLHSNALSFVHQRRLIFALRNCRAALKKLFCEYAYPSCTADATPLPRFPCENSCTNIVSVTCGASDLPYIDARLQLYTVQDRQLENLGFPGGASSCQEMYDPFRATYAATTCIPVQSVSTKADCGCGLVDTSAFPFCGPYIGSHQVWDFISRNASFFDARAQERYDDAVYDTQPGTVHAPCANCTADLKRAICQAMIPKCVNDALPIQRACRASCDRVLTVCRTRDTLDAGYAASFRSRSLGLATQDEIDAINGFCSSTLFEQTAGACLDAYPSTPPPICPCDPPPPLQQFDLCRPFITYPVHHPTTVEMSNIEEQLRRYLAPYYNISNPVVYRVCPNCNNSLVETMCRMAYPRCLPAGGVRSARNDSCDTMANGICKVPGFKRTCETWVNGLPANDSSAEAITNRSPCGCSSIPQSQLTNNCKRFITYPVPYGWSTDSAVSLVSTDADKQIKKFDQVKTLLCTNCSESVIRSICEAYFPRCTNDDHILPACSSGCTGNLRSCNLPGLASSFCGLLQNEAASLPGINSCSDTSSTALTGTCNYCGRRDDTGQCRDYVNWDTYVGSLPGLDITKFTNLAEFVLPTINFPNCSDCTFQIRRTMCSVFVLPCNLTIVDKLVSKFITLPADTTVSAEDALNAVTRPCFSKCQEVLSQCLTTLPPNPKNFFFACDAKLPGLPPNLDLYDKTGDCVIHDYPSLPGTCPLYVATAPRSSSGTPPPTGSSGVITGGGLSSGAIAGIVIVAVVLPIILAAVVAVMYIRRLWIFRIKRVDLESMQPDDRDSRVVSLEQADWSKAKKPRVVSNLK